MRESAKILSCVLATLALSMSVEALVADSSPAAYQSITDRNLFHLQPAPPPQIVEPPALPLPKILLNGITTVLGRKLAIMKVLFSAKPGEPAKEQSYMLAEGERDGDIEVLQVDEKAGSAKVNNSGTVMMLTLDKDAPKSAAAVSPAPLSPTGAIPPPVPPATNPFVPTTTPGGQKLLSLRNLRLPASGATLPIPNASNATPLPAATPAPITNAQPQTAALGRPLTPEEQVVLRELEREAAK